MGCKMAEQASILWSPKVSPEKIRRLYASEAAGRLDEELLEDVLISLYLRCKSILTVTEAVDGRVTCPVCGEIIIRTAMRQGKRRHEEMIHCPLCGWEVTWEQFYRSYKEKQLWAKNALPAIHAFVAGFALAEHAREKILLIDCLIHAFHNELADHPDRPVAINVIAGKWPDVIKLLLDLAYGDDPAIEELRQYWRKKLPAVRLPLGDALPDLSK